MPQPTQSDVHVDAILTNISVAYIQDHGNFIAQKVFPVVPVDKQSDKYFTYKKDDWSRDEAELRADSTESAGSGYNLSTDSYSADVYAFHKDIGDQTRANTDNPLDADRDATEFVTQTMLQRQEQQWVSDYFTTGKWATDKNGAGNTDFTQWNDFAASDPIEVVEDAKEQVLKTTGFMINTVTLGYQVWRKLKNHPDFVDRVKWTSAEALSTNIFARYLDIDRVLVAQSIKNTAKEGQTASYGFNFGKNVLFTHSAKGPSLRTPTAGYTFTWRQISDGLGQDIGITRFRMQHLRADRVEAQVAWVNKLVASDMGYFLSAAVA